MVESSGLYEMLWFAGISFIVFAILLIVCSAVMWCKKEKLSKLAYIANMILTIILYISLVYDSYLEKRGFEIILLVLGIAFLLSSIFLNRKECITKMKIMMNIATIIGFIIFSRIVFILN